MKVLAVVPAYNEQDCLAQTIERLRRECPSIDYLVVNDGSKDHTSDVIKTHHMNALELPVNTGLASGVRSGMKYAFRHDYDAVVQFDADGQHLPTYIPLMAQALEQQSADIVIASRYLESPKPRGARGMGSRLISWLIRVTTGSTITDPTSGMRMYNKKMIAHFAKGFDVEPEPDTLAWVLHKGGKVIEIPAQMQERQGGESYLKFASIVTYMSRTCLSIVLFQWLR